MRAGLRYHVQVSGLRQQIMWLSCCLSPAGGKPAKGSRDWVLGKKEVMRKRGYTSIPEDTKYTGRKRSKYRQ
jgi:hypothetical protein